MADSLVPGNSKGPAGGNSSPPDGAVLVIGSADAATLAQAEVPGGPVFVAPFGSLDAALLARLSPRWVVFPLMAAGFDAPLVIEVLVELGYSGRACVVAPRLPNRRMVEIELRAIAPSLHLILVEAPD